MTKAICPVCPHACGLREGQTGLCGARKNVRGLVIDANYGMLTAVALDPIEKKPLYRFFPGSHILSVGSYGCSMKCSFCQNSDISMPDGYFHAEYTPPGQLVEKALALKERGNIGIAYTYNEPLVGYEYVYDCSRLAHTKGLKNVVVTNGMIMKKPLLRLLPHIDAMNIDLKAFTKRFYREADGDFDTVTQTIRLSMKRCHVEVTTLIVPGENDSEKEMEAIASWLGSLDEQTPLHVSRFFPRHHMINRSATPVETVYRLAEVARRHLKYVYEGNC